MLPHGQDLDAFEGIGDNLAERIAEVVHTGRAPKLNEGSCFVATTFGARTLAPFRKSVRSKQCDTTVISPLYKPHISECLSSPLGENNA